MNQIGRILAVTAGLIIGGAIFGAVAGMIALSIAMAVTGGFGAIDWMGVRFAGAVGAVFGGFLLPLAGWVVLRRVPLWLTFTGTLLGTIAGGAAGWFVGAGQDPIRSGTWGAVIGFALATLLLRLTVGRATRVEGTRVPVS